MAERVTLKKIAQLANVSIGTVDRALNDRARINPETKKRILEIARMLNYRPNSAARVLGKATQYRIGIVMASTPKEFCDHLKHGVCDALDELCDFGVKGQFFISNSLAPSSQLQAIEKIDPDKFDAFLVNAGSREIGTWIDSMVAAGKEVATFNSDVKNSRRMFYVGDEPYQAGRLMGGYISACLKLKAPRIAVLTGFEGHESHEERCRGVIDAVVAACPDACILRDSYQDEQIIAYRKIMEMMERGERLDAVFLASAGGVLGACTAVESLPEESRPSVFGYDVYTDMVPYMEKGVYSACIFQEPYWQGYYAAMLLGRHGALDVPLNREFYKIRSKLITRYNVNDYLMDKHQSDEFLL